MPYKLILAYAVLGASAIFYTIFWIWAIVHAASTPKAVKQQRIFWSVSMIINPLAAVWYWYIWKRWTFWILFTPLFGFFLSLPLIIRSLMTKADETFWTNILFALGTYRLIVFAAVLLIFPLLLRLAALLHLGKNFDLESKSRNDWVISIALPFFGFGAGLAYCAKYRRSWAIASLIWWAIAAWSFYLIGGNITQLLAPIGEERREQFKSQQVTFMRHI